MTNDLFVKRRLDIGARVAGKNEPQSSCVSLLTHPIILPC